MSSSTSQSTEADTLLIMDVNTCSRTLFGCARSNLFVPLFVTGQPAEVARDATARQGLIFLHRVTVEPDKAALELVHSVAKLTVTCHLSATRVATAEAAPSRDGNGTGQCHLRCTERAG